MKRYEKYLTKGFGPHLTCDGYGCHAGKLKDMDYIYEFLDGLPTILGMRKIGKPDVDKVYDDGKVEDYGVSGIVLIMESHIALHTFPNKGCLFLDIFSCKDFDVEEAKKYIVEYFKITAPVFKLTQRGDEFPKNIEEAKILWAQERGGTNVEKV